MFIFLKNILFEPLFSQTNDFTKTFRFFLNFRKIIVDKNKILNQNVKKIYSLNGFFNFYKNINFEIIYLNFLLKYIYRNSLKIKNCGRKLCESYKNKKNRIWVPLSTQQIFFYDIKKILQQTGESLWDTLYIYSIHMYRL